MSSSESSFIDDDMSTDLPNLSTGNSLYTFIEYVVIIIIIIVICYIVYRVWFNKRETLNNNSNNTKEIVQVPNLRNKTIIDVLQWCAETYPDFPALMVRKDNGNWSDITYENYYQKCLDFAKSVNYWVGPKAKVAIIGFNSPAWFYSHLGCLMNSGISVGMYPTSSPEICEYILNHAEVDVLVVEDSKQLEKLVGKDMSKLKLILYYSPISDELIKKFSIPVVSFGAFIESKETGKIKLPGNVSSDDTATIIYTSGTTASPKGVLITHKNIISNVDSVLQTLQSKSTLKLENGERFVSYLPLNHIAAQMMDIYIPICIIGTVWFADRDALKSTLVNTLRDARPTVFIGVPRVYEKMQEKIEEKVQSSFISRNLPNILIRNKIINEIGLNKCKFCITSAAPISAATRDYFANTLNITLYDAYGLSETSGPITLSCPGLNCNGSVGCPTSDVRIKIASDGEILVKSQSVFKGYYKDSKGTKEAFEGSWFKTGDIGYINDGFLFITGRKKELIITANGENIAQVPIEQELCKRMPELEYAVVIGDKRKFLSVILVPKMKDGEIAKCFKKIDPEIKSVKDLNTSSKIKEYVDGKINELNSGAKSNSCKVQKYFFVTKEFTVGAELTPTLKLRRNFISEKYKNKIDKLYEEAKTET